ncbi:MAG TPA: nitronate monooxygenase [Pseudonocardiaceae bacterium]|jgi:nitronate monooxygenase|nr:nitronate monooxygenase [Pseudonocardiaceae bacterium]
MFESVRIPVIAAPMAGGPSTPELVAAVTEAGGFGFLGGGYLAPEALAGQLDRCRELTALPFGVNMFVPGLRSTVDVSGYRDELAEEARRYDATPGEPNWTDDQYPEKLDLLIERRIPVVSFTFGLPSRTDVDRLHAVDAAVVVTVTSPDEARHAARIGADALCVQGFEAGGHRGTFTDDPHSATGGELLGLLAALRLIAATVDLPLIAAGGLVHGADVAAVLAAGAVAAQCGTAFLRCPEAGTPAPQRAALAEGTRPTTLTRAFSGRTARGLVNRFIQAHGGHAPAAYPQVNAMTKPIRGAAAKAGDAEAMSLWAGQTYSLATDAPAAEVITRLAAEATEALDRASKRLG